MKKLIFALALMASSAHATSWTAYYTASDTLPSFASDSLGLASNATFHNINNPTSPTPPVASNWFLNPSNTSGYATIPLSTLGATEGQIDFYWRQQVRHSFNYDAVRISNGIGTILLRVQYDGTNQRMRIYYGAVNVANSAANSVTTGASVKIEITYSTSGGSLTIDGGTPVTNIQPLNLTSAAIFYVMGNPVVGPVTGATDNFMDGLAISTSASDTFPPTVPTATSTTTPTGTTTPTSTVTPSNTPTSTETLIGTRTNTPVVSATNTVTPSNTPTNTPTFTRTVTLTNTPTSSSTITPSVTKTRTVTSTNTRTPTPTRTISATASATPSVTPSFTRSFTPTPVVTNTWVPNYMLAGRHVNIIDGPGSSATNPLYVLIVTPTDTPTLTGPQQTATQVALSYTPTKTPVP